MTRGRSSSTSAAKAASRRPRNSVRSSSKPETRDGWYASATWRGSNWAPSITRRTAISTTPKRRTGNLSASRFQRVVDRRFDHRNDGGVERRFPAGARTPDHLQPDRLRRRLDRSGLSHAVRGGDSRGLDDLRVFTKLAIGRGPVGGDPGFAGGHLRGDGSDRVFAEQPVPVRV